MPFGDEILMADEMSADDEMRGNMTIFGDRLRESALAARLVTSRLPAMRDKFAEERKPKPGLFEAVSSSAARHYSISLIFIELFPSDEIIFYIYRQCSWAFNSRCWGFTSGRRARAEHTAR